MPTQVLSRKQFYDLVWSKPLTQLSEELGMSDNGLRKICKKYDIPLPKMGHWQKVQYGKKTEQEKLGNFDKWVNTQILINESEGDDQDHYLTKIAKRVKEIEQSCSKFLPVPEKLIKPHHFIKVAKANLNAQKKGNNWRNLPQCIQTNINLLSISVQKHNVARALRIMDVFIKMAEYRGHEIVNEESTTLIIDGERFKICFREKHTRQNILNERWPTTEMVPNDKLSIKYEYFISKEWVDKGMLLEEQLPRILAFFELKSIEDKEEKERFRIAQLEASRNREIEQKFSVQRVWEEKKQGVLMASSQEWRKAEDLRQFIKKIEASKDNSDKVHDWLKWSKQQLLELDPLSDGIEEFVRQFDLPDSLK
jgi:hypothetical protein